MDTIIFGAGNAGQHLYEEIIESTDEFNVIAFLDNKVNGRFKDIPIMKPADFFAEKKVETAFVAAGAQKTLKIMVDTLVKNKVPHIYMMHDIVGKNRMSVFNKGKLISERVREIRFSEKKPTLPYIEIPITDLCNLNCKGCLFACNALEGNEHISFEQIKKDAYRMSDLFFDVPWIRILGGEPLLHPEIINILKLYRKVFPESEIDLCTNGLLLPKMKEDFFDCLRNNHITIHVSGYKPTYNMLDKIDLLLNQNHLNYTVLKREKFSKYYTKNKDKNKDISFMLCPASGCRELYKGRLLRCSGVIAYEKFNQQFKTTYETRENEDWFYIHNENIDPWEVTKKLDSASSICSYCDINRLEEFDWDYAGKNVTINDYVLK